MHVEVLQSNTPTAMTMPVRAAATQIAKTLEKTSKVALRSCCIVGQYRSAVMPRDILGRAHLQPHFLTVGAPLQAKGRHHKQQGLGHRAMVA